MHKRLLLSLILTGHLGARPSALLEQMDHRLPILPTAALRQRLDQAEALFARQGDWNHLLETRCRRAELLFYEKDPSLPEDTGLARWTMDQARALQEQIPGDEAAYAWI